LDNLLHSIFSIIWNQFAALVPIRDLLGATNLASEQQPSNSKSTKPLTLYMAATGAVFLRPLAVLFFSTRAHVTFFLLPLCFCFLQPSLIVT
jgi:hypothetical protein